MIARVMGQTKITPPTVSLYTVDKAISKLHKNSAVDSDELAALMIKRLFKKPTKERVKVLPFSYENCKVFSQFSSEFQNQLEHLASKKVEITKENKSIYILGGNYFFKEGNLVVSGQLYDQYGTIRSSAIIKMKIEDKERLYYLPKKNEYATMNDAIHSDTLNIQTRINGQKDYLLFREGESINLEIKVSQEAYIYIIANMRTAAGKQVQYLLPVSHKNGMAQYSKFIPYQNSNLWISFETFEVFAPFGSEALHIFASSQNILDKLPKVSRQKIDGEIYDGVIVDANNAVMSADQSISKVRGLKIKSNKPNRVLISETVLKFTTVKE